MRWVKEYAKSRCRVICLYGGSGALAAAVFWLYRMPLEPAAYALALCLMLAAVAVAVDFRRYYRKAVDLERQMEAVKNGTEKLPDPSDGLEWRYQRLLGIARESRVEQVAMLVQDKAGVTDYFTLWAHQIKTPIAAMHLLLQQELSGPEEYYVQRRGVEAELFKIEQYVEMVLQYLRLNSGINDFVLKEYSLDAIIFQAVRKYAPMFIRQGLSLQYEPVRPKAVTDEKWMVFVLEQVLSNAIKYTPAGCISIYLENGCLVVEDTGIGILPEDLPRVFDKGYTGYNGRSDKKASGIGLYLVKEVLNKLGHKIMMESKPGEGTRVKILF